MKKLKKSMRIEEEIRKAKLKDVKKMKEELEQKLSSLNQNASFLATSPITKKDMLNEKGLTKEEKQKLEEELEKKRKEAEEFIIKLKKEKQERKKKEEERMKQLEEKLKKDSEELNKRLKEKEEEMLKKRKEETMKTYELLKKQREEDSKKKEEVIAKTFVPPKDEYLYKKLEEKYNKEVLMPELESKKQELAKKRNLFKPVRKEELEEHMRKFEQVMAQKEEARLEEIKHRKEQQQNIAVEIRKFKTQTLEKKIEEERKLKEEMEKKKHVKADLREKMESYAHLLKETVTVKTSDQKAAELKKQIESLKHPVRQNRDTRKEYDLAVLNKRSLKDNAGSRSMDKLRAESSQPGDTEGGAKLVDRATEIAKSQRFSAKEKKKRDKALALQEEIKKAEEAKEKAKKLDYLGELRKKREEHYGASKPVKYDWTNDLKDEKLNPSEKYSRLVGKANMIEEQAKMKEKLLQAKGGTEKNPEMGEFVSDMFIDAIKAKLAILENL